MNIFFVDAANDLALSSSRPGAGALARELAAVGHSVALVGDLPAGRDDALRILPLSQGGWEGAETAEAVILGLAGGAEIVQWRSRVGAPGLWLLWIGEEADEAATAFLEDEAVRAAFDGFLFAGEAQAQRFHDRLGITWDRMTVLLRGEEGADQAQLWNRRAMQAGEVLAGQLGIRRFVQAAAAAAKTSAPTLSPEDLAAEQFADDLARIADTGSIEAMEAFLRHKKPSPNQMVFTIYRLLLRSRFQPAYLLAKRLGKLAQGHPVLPLALSLGGLLFDGPDDEKKGIADLTKQINMMAVPARNMFYLQVLRPVGAPLLETIDPALQPRLRKILQAGAPQFRGKDSFELK